MTFRQVMDTSSDYGTRSQIYPDPRYARMPFGLGDFHVLHVTLCGSSLLISLIDAIGSIKSLGSCIYYRTPRSS